MGDWLLEKLTPQEGDSEKMLAARTCMQTLQTGWKEYLPNASRTASITGPVIDTRGYKAVAFMLNVVTAHALVPTPIIWLQDPSHNAFTIGTSTIVYDPDTVQNVLYVFAHSQLAPMLPGTLIDYISVPLLAEVQLFIDTGGTDPIEYSVDYQLLP